MLYNLKQQEKNFDLHHYKIQTVFINSAILEEIL